MKKVRLSISRTNIRVHFKTIELKIVNKKESFTQAPVKGKNQTYERGRYSHSPLKTCLPTGSVPLLSTLSRNRHF